MQCYDLYLTLRNQKLGMGVTVKLAFFIGKRRILAVKRACPEFFCFVLPEPSGWHRSSVDCDCM